MTSCSYEMIKSFIDVEFEGLCVVAAGLHIEAKLVMGAVLGSGIASIFSFIASRLICTLLTFILGLIPMLW